MRVFIRTCHVKAVIWDVMKAVLMARSIVSMYKWLLCGVRQAQLAFGDLYCKRACKWKECDEAAACESRFVEYVSDFLASSSKALVQPRFWFWSEPQFADLLKQHPSVCTRDSSLCRKETISVLSAFVQQPPHVGGPGFGFSTCHWGIAMCFGSFLFFNHVALLGIFAFVREHS